MDHDIFYGFLQSGPSIYLHEYASLWPACFVSRELYENVVFDENCYNGKTCGVIGSVEIGIIWVLMCDIMKCDNVWHWATKMAKTDQWDKPWIEYD